MRQLYKTKRFQHSFIFFILSRLSRVKNQTNQWHFYPYFIREPQTRSATNAPTWNNLPSRNVNNMTSHLADARNVIFVIRQRKFDLLNFRVSFPHRNNFIIFLLETKPFTCLCLFVKNKTKQNKEIQEIQRSSRDFLSIRPLS